MSEFPVLKATTGNFRRGMPRSVTVFGTTEDWCLLYLSSEGPTDGVLRLRARTSTGEDWILVDPNRLLADGEVPAAERARRERLRESGAGITGYSCDKSGSLVAFALAGQLWTVPVQGDGEPTMHVPDGVIDPRLSPDGSSVAFHRAGGLHLLELASGSVRTLAETTDRTWGLAEFIAAEEMGRYRGFWWSPDSQQLLVAAVNEDGVDTWWIGDPANPASTPRSVRYPAAGTPNASVELWLVDRAGDRRRLSWDAAAFPYLTDVSWTAGGAVISVQSRDQQSIRIYRVHDELKLAAEQNAKPWLELVPGAPTLTPDGRLLTVRVDSATDSWRLALDADWLTSPDWYVRSIHRCDDDGVWVSATQNPRENHLLYVRWDGSYEQISQQHGWNSVLAAGPVPVLAEASLAAWQPKITVGGATTLPNLAAAPPGVPRVENLPLSGAVRVAVILPETRKPAPVIVSSYGGPHAQRVLSSALSFATEQWFSDQGFVVVTIDGRGSPGVSPSVEHAIAGDLAGPPLADQVAGLYQAAEAFPGRLDLQRVGITGWSFGGYLAALAVLWNPEVFQAAFAGAPVTDWRLYDTHYTERYLGDPTIAAELYDRSSLLTKASNLRRPLVLAHGLADDNVVAAHTLQLSAALTAAGRPHQVLPLPGVTHMTPQAAVTENLLRLELDFFRTHLFH